MSYFSIIKKIFYFVIYEKKYSKNQKIEHFFLFNIIKNLDKYFVINNNKPVFFIWINNKLKKEIDTFIFNFLLIFFKFYSSYKN